MHEEKSPEKIPGFGEAVIVLIICTIVLVGGILLFGFDTPIVLLLTTIILSLFGVTNKIPYKEIQTSMLEALGSAVHVLVLLTLVGGLVGTMMAAGTIPYIIDTGLKLIRPVIFLPLTVVLCSILSSCTGSAISVMFTMGVACMGIAKGLGIPLPITAGAVLSGAYFGDKQSPVSGFAAFAASISHTDHTKHLKNMLYTTIPATLSAMVVFFILGLGYGKAPMSTDIIEYISGSLNESFKLSPIAILPLLVMIVLILFKMPSLPAIAFGSLTAVAVAVLYQGVSLTDAMAIMVNGYRTTSTVDFVITMANRGGMISMAHTIICISLSLCMGGAINRTHVMDVIIERLKTLISNPKGLVITTVFTAFLSHYATAQVMPASILTANVFEKEYDKQGVDRSMLSRSISDGALVSCPIVPWDPDGICAIQALEIPTLTFAPYYLVMWFTLLFAVLSAVTGIGLKMSSVPTTSSAGNQ